MFKPKVIGKQKFGDILIDQIEITGHLFVNRNTILYGASGQGKTEFLKYLMACMHKEDLIPVWYVFTATPTNFDDRVPIPFIYLKYSSEILSTIYERNEAQTAVYNECNKLIVLRQLYKMRPDMRVDKILRNLEEQKKKDLAELALKIKDNDALKNWEEELEIKCMETERALLKKYISAYLDFFKKQKINDDQAMTLEYIDFNPKVGIVFDDIAALVASASKKEKKVLLEIYFQGRNQNLTTFMTAQQDTAMDKAYRDNAHINVYADSGSTSTCFSAGRQMPKSITTRVQSLLKTPTFFDRGEGENKVFRMLMLFRMFGDMLCFAVSQRVPLIQYGSAAYWEYGEKILKSSLDRQQDNKFMQIHISRGKGGGSKYR